MEHCHPLVTVSALLHRVAFVDVRAAIKDKCLRACVHIHAAAQVMLMHQFENNTAAVLPKQPDRPASSRLLCELDNYIFSSELQVLFYLNRLAFHLQREPSKLTVPF